MTQGVVAGPTAKKREGSMAFGVATAMPMLRAAQVLIAWETVLDGHVSSTQSGQLKKDLQHLKRTADRFAEWVENQGNAV
jgi:hypothetical protein